MSSDKIDVPTNTRIEALNKRGIAKLANGTFWQIARADLPLARKWGTGTAVILDLNEPGSLWEYKLTNQNTGDWAGVLPSMPPANATLRAGRQTPTTKARR